MSLATIVLNVKKKYEALPVYNKSGSFKNTFVSIVLCYPLNGKYL